MKNQKLTRRTFSKQVSMATPAILMGSNLLNQNAISSFYNINKQEVNTPDWVKNAIFYQIFPDRFGKSPIMKHPPGMKFAAWGSDPDKREFQGGDLYAVIDKLDYLNDLGINAIYFNPIFSAASEHRYNTYDYFKVDPILGGNNAFKELLDKAHAKGIKIILDGVFNHCSRGFWQFNHILENEEKSPYIDWFHIKEFPLRAYSFTEEKPAQYGHWQRFPRLPKFNTDIPAVREFLFKVAKFWINFGVDGWRLDVATDIKDDTFWREFRGIVKNENPQAYIVAEHWQEAKKWLQGDMFDGVMNYIFSSASIGFFGAKSFKNFNYSHWPMQVYNAEEFRNRIEYNLSLYDWNITQTMLNIIDSHDTPRAMELLGYDKSALKLCVIFQMTMPGAPCIYYGDEIGNKGKNRDAFPYNQPEVWDMELLAFYKAIIKIRKENKVLRTGTYKTLFAKDEVFIFERKLKEKTSIIAFNSGLKDHKVSIFSKVQNFKQEWPFTKSLFKVNRGRVSLDIPAREVIILT